MLHLINQFCQNNHQNTEKLCNNKNLNFKDTVVRIKIIKINAVLKILFWKTRFCITSYKQNKLLHYFFKLQIVY